MIATPWGEPPSEGPESPPPGETNGCSPPRDSVDAAVVALEDVTARHRIREAALQHFAEEGYERATIRAIALTAGVSHGMLRHHYGSKLALRAACDDYVVDVLSELNSAAAGSRDVALRSGPDSNRFWLYAARSLADGSLTAAPMFDEMVTMSERMLLQNGQRTAEQQPAAGRTQAAVLTAMAAGIPLFHEHLSRVLGVDVLTPDGHRLVMLTLMELFARNLEDD